ncbi:glycoside hydrolase family 19 protein [Sphingobacterium sp. SGG-5]|uniref:glycoside hydrolase family 19 protein n=1 Tax=Sphingobacterium sp. SGG-5 TaxID=2710881 RepID=UPI0013E9E0D3|nr:glycoside hydrolase family 19 protein [Sphingobacterium sp. SGG-5]NGM63523.1 glycoside hydrolase family 19 protein [Sphingobacterium sp. SGG-5]
MTPKNRIKQIQRTVGATPDGIIGNDTLTKFQCHYKVPTKAMAAHFFGNLHHESAGFSIVEENLRYSAQRILQVFPKYFKTLGQAQQVAYNPEALANNVYGGRMGNNTVGDGYKFRGRGFMQTTGKFNYDRLGKFLGVDLLNNPDLVATMYPLESAVFYFNDNRLWGLAGDVSEDSIQLIRRRVNGGLNGLDDVRNKVLYYYNLMK